MTRVALSILIVHIDATTLHPPVIPMASLGLFFPECDRDQCLLPHRSLHRASHEDTLYEVCTRLFHRSCNWHAVLQCRPAASPRGLPSIRTDPHTHTPFHVKAELLYRPTKLWHPPLIHARFRLSCGLSWPPPRCLSLFSQAFLGSNKHCEKLFGFAVPSLHLLGGYVRVRAVCYFVLCLHPHRCQEVGFFFGTFFY